MQRFALLIFLVGYIAVLTFYAAAGAQSQTVLKLPEPCSNKDRTACGAVLSSTNTVLICLKAQGREIQSCPVALSMAETPRRPLVLSDAALRPKVN